MTPVKPKRQDRIIEVEAETYQKGWEVTYNLMESYFSDKLTKRVNEAS